MDTSAAWPVHAYYPDDDPDWLVVYWFARLGDSTELVGFEIKSMPTGGDDSTYFEHPDGPTIEPKPLRSTTLKYFPLDSERHAALRVATDLMPAIRALVDDQPNATNVATWDSFTDAFGDDDEPDERRVGRPPKYRQEHFEFVAALYRQAKAAGVRRTNVWIAEELTRAWGEDVTRKTAERLVYRARHEFDLLGEDEA